MRRTPHARPLSARVLAALAALVVGCADPTGVPGARDAVPGGAAAADVPDDPRPVEIVVIGDVPYGEDAMRRFPAVVDAINAEPRARWVVHVGDIKSGTTPCTDEWFGEVARQFARFRVPLVYAIGDNEWTDCHRPAAGGYHPLERLAAVRRLFFATPGRVLGGGDLAVEAQPGYPENQLWGASRVTYAALHVVGSNNGLAPWFGSQRTPAQAAEQKAEYAGRHVANVAWLERTFAAARTARSAGVVLFLQADMRADFATPSGHQGFVQHLARLATAFSGPVLLVSGDSHDYRVDVGVPWFSRYGVTPPANVTQVIVDQTIEDDVEWLRLHVDPTAPAVFRWERVRTP
jgi:hypothetical protein